MTPYISISINLLLGFIGTISFIIILLNFFFNILGELAKNARPILGIVIIAFVILNPLFLYFAHRNEFTNNKKGFFKRNKDAILMLIISAIVGLLSTTLGLFVQKYLNII